MAEPMVVTLPLTLLYPMPAHWPWVASASAVVVAVAALARARRACVLTGQLQPRWLMALAAAQDEAGDFEAAQATAQQAKIPALSQSASNWAALCDQLLAHFKAGRPFRELEPGIRSPPAY